MKRKANYKLVVVLFAIAIAAIYFASMVTDYLAYLFPFQKHLLKPLIEIPIIILVVLFLLVPIFREYSGKDREPSDENK